ncbi:MAG: GNAT family N-acetyltransferase [Cyanobacteria bacterium P01_A01_bin.123]
MFQTERLLVRHITDADVEAMHAVYGDAEAMKWVDDGQPLDRQGCIQWIDVTHRNYMSRGYGMSALVLKRTDAIAGFCGLVHPGRQPQVEIKYALLRAYWGQGLATEAVRGMLDYAREHLKIPRVIATIAPENKASRRVLLKVGMNHLETHRNEDETYTETLVWLVENFGNRD